MFLCVCACVMVKLFLISADFHLKHTLSFASFPRFVIQCLIVQQVTKLPLKWKTTIRYGDYRLLIDWCGAVGQMFWRTDGLSSFYSNVCTWDKSMCWLGQCLLGRPENSVFSACYVMEQFCFCPIRVMITQLRSRTRSVTALTCRWEKMEKITIQSEQSGWGQTWSTPSKMSLRGTCVSSWDYRYSLVPCHRSSWNQLNLTEDSNIYTSALSFVLI